MAEQFYSPLFNSAYLKNSTGYPPTLNSITYLKACKVDNDIYFSTPIYVRSNISIYFRNKIQNN